jgi:hypothetical protein
METPNLEIGSYAYGEIRLIFRFVSSAVGSTAALKKDNAAEADLQRADVSARFKQAGIVARAEDTARSPIVLISVFSSLMIDELSDE